VEAQDIRGLERFLADCVRSYSQRSERTTELEQSEKLRNVCSVMATVLGKLLQMEEGWNEYWWVDDVTSPVVTSLSDDEFQLQGLMVWGQKGSSQEWIEPCAMTMSKTVDQFRYVMFCGDAHCGLGTTVYRSDATTFGLALPEQWKFVLSRQSSSAG
jgi:hypothetical protein